ncbi:polyphosphate kinase 1 [Seonamhaeicola marinus]|uniref:Polyphosphate kinase n=1 Tax=Seonamhaeicola marinus TaxID=1912246 RepID=A0A5D0HTG5_9FLAO|nr:polyphosphate kinase 1 [Seonamhaeicola marinus]TYA74608.1 polyphosphate kinase 1 [Seonamhaeicola marinus]
MQNKYIDRDLSWLSFNERVLQEAENKSLPLYERLNFLAIFSSNLDEFYRVRVSELRHFKRLQKDAAKKLTEKPKQLVRDVQEKVMGLQERFGTAFEKDIIPNLKKEDIYLIEHEEYSEIQREFVFKYFENEVKSHISIYDLNTDFEQVLLKDKGLFLFLDIDKDVLITIPADKLPRFLVLPSNDSSFYVTYLDEVVRANLKFLNKIFEDVASYCVKITRDAELYFDEFEGELVETIKQSLDQRDTGIPTRMLYDKKMPKELVRRLHKQLALNKTDLMPGGRYHNFSDFFGFPKPLNSSTLCYPKQESYAHPDLEYQSSLIKYLKENDALLSFPYQKFDYIPRLIIEAAESSEIHAINITLYRVSKDSVVANALLKCLEQGKKVTVFIEAKARFDEKNNIYWGEKLKSKGATVLYSMPKLKVHSKILLLEGNDFDLAYVGTGNFNEKTARLYTDFVLLTTSRPIASDLKQVFQFLHQPEGFKPRIHTVWMSPFTTRTSLYSKINREIKFAKANKPASIILKMNSLEDEGVIDKLYEASQAGVKIRLIVRGIFRLLPGIKGLSENITAVSIVGRYLEHSRIYCFGNGGQEEVYIASADCMTRNLDKRVEVCVPVLEPRLKAILKKCIDLQWEDNVKARLLDAQQTNTYSKTEGHLINSQKAYFDFFKNKTVEKNPRVIDMFRL